MKNIAFPETGYARKDHSKVVKTYLDISQKRAQHLTENSVWLKDDLDPIHNLTVATSHDLVEGFLLLHKTLKKGAVESLTEQEFRERFAHIRAMSVTFRDDFMTAKLHLVNEEDGDEALVGSYGSARFGTSELINQLLAFGMEAEFVLSYMTAIHHSNHSEVSSSDDDEDETDGDYEGGDYPSIDFEELVERLGLSLSFFESSPEPEAQEGFPVPADHYSALEVALSRIFRAIEQEAVESDDTGAADGDAHRECVSKDCGLSAGVFIPYVINDITQFEGELFQVGALIEDAWGGVFMLDYDPKLKLGWIPWGDKSFGQANPVAPIRVLRHSA